MKRFSVMLKETWWAWSILIAGGLTAGFLVSFIFFAAIPISFISFVYFALVRYDDDGKPRVQG